MSLFDNLLSIFKAPISDGKKVVLAQKEIESNSNILVDRMLGIRKKLDPASLQWFSDQIPISLAVAHTNLEIWSRGGRGLFVTEFDGDPDYTTIRFNDIASSIYPVRSGSIKGAFKRILLTNTAQAGKTLKFIIGYRNFAEYRMLAPDRATKEHHYTVAVTLADTEYSQVLPPHTKRFLIHLRDASSFKVSFGINHVAGPGSLYLTVPASSDYGETNVDLVDKTLYFASTVASKYAEIIAWT